MKNNDSAKTTKQNCEDCGRKTPHTYKTYGGGYIYRCNRCQRSREGKI